MLDHPQLKNASRTHHRSARRRSLSFAGLIVAIACGLPYPAAAQTGDELTVRDVCVFRVSAYGTELNPRSLFRSGLPDFVISQRTPAGRKDALRATPVGLMTFEGGGLSDIDVLLEFTSGRFLGFWPPANRRSKRLLWTALKLDAQAEPTHSLIDAHWLSPLRSAPRLYVEGREKRERFLLYDAEVRFRPHIKLERVEQGYQVANQAADAIHNVLVLRPEGADNWRAAAVAMVPGVGKKKSTAKPGTQAGPEAVFDQADSGATPPLRTPLPAGDAGTQTLAPEADTGTDKGTEDDGDFRDPAEGTDAAEVVPVADAEEAAAQFVPAGVPVEVGPGGQPLAPGGQPQQAKPPAPRPSKKELAKYVGGQPVAITRAVANWKQDLLKLGLAEAEAQVVHRIIADQARDSREALVVYRLDPDTLEELLPLELTPIPNRVVRVGIVILQDADPDLQTEIAKLITQLGDDSWKQREAAQDRLKQLGLAAKPKLDEAVKHTDAEIAFRAEQLLEQIDD